MEKASENAYCSLVIQVKRLLPYLTQLFTTYPAETRLHYLSMAPRDSDISDAGEKRMEEYASAQSFSSLTQY
jgi:hypothetical protein